MNTLRLSKAPVAVKLAGLLLVVLLRTDTSVCYSTDAITDATVAILRAVIGDMVAQL